MQAECWCFGRLMPKVIGQLWVRKRETGVSVRGGEETELYMGGGGVEERRRNYLHLESSPYSLLWTFGRNHYVFQPRGFLPLVSGFLCSSSSACISVENWEQRQKHLCSFVALCVTRGWNPPPPPPLTEDRELRRKVLVCNRSVVTPPPAGCLCRGGGVKLNLPLFDSAFTTSALWHPLC